MNLEELLKQPIGKIITLDNGARLLIEENDHYEGDRTCYGVTTHKMCYFLKDKDGNWRKQDCPGSKGYCLNCYTELDESTPVSDVMNKTGIELITAERERQIKEEGWTPDHDAQHTNGELADAAATYAMTLRNRLNLMILAQEKNPNLKQLPTWPFDKKWWKPSEKDRIRELIKAGALIAAEIDRLIAEKHKANEKVIKG